MPTILITGASRGIGQGLAKLYEANGWKVIATVRSAEAAEKLATAQITAEPLDVTDSDAVKALAAKYATTPIDLVIANAGVVGQDNPLEAPTLTNFRKTFETNVFGALQVPIAFLPSLRLAPNSKIAGISSILGSIGSATPYPGGYTYKASKAALNATYSALAADLKAENISVVLVHPGWVQTDMGGASAPVTLDASVTGIKKVLDGVTPADTGRFLAFDGSELPW